MQQKHVFKKTKNTAKQPLCFYNSQNYVSIESEIK